jgi:hypothetical protein
MRHSFAADLPVGHPQPDVAAQSAGVKLKRDLQKIRAPMHGRSQLTENPVVVHKE